MRPLIINLDRVFEHTVESLAKWLGPQQFCPLVKVFKNVWVPHELIVFPYLQTANYSGGQHKPSELIFEYAWHILSTINRSNAVQRTRIGIQSRLSYGQLGSHTATILLCPKSSAEGLKKRILSKAVDMSILEKKTYWYKCSISLIIFWKIVITLFSFNFVWLLHAKNSL